MVQTEATDDACNAPCLHPGQKGLVDADPSGSHPTQRGPWSLALSFVLRSWSRVKPQAEQDDEMADVQR